MESRSLVIENVTVYPAPDAPPIERGTVVAQDGRITAVGADLSAPPGAEVISGEGRVLTAGFWNAHVHFTEPRWRSAARAPASTLNDQLRDMLTSRGFTTVVDAGSDPRHTLPLRRRIDSSELLGPAVYTAGPSMFPPRGIPYYVRDDLSFWIRPFVPQPSTPAAAARVAERNLARGADLVKLFTGSYVERGKVTNMPEAIARAAADVAHRHGRLTYSHASNLEGTRVALAAGVDVLAHPPDSTDGVDDALLRRVVDRRMAMIPTLKMFADTVRAGPAYLESIYDVVCRFRALGGELLFGTDVGYLTDYTTEGEFRALGRCGLGARDVLRMLTTAPAERFGVGADRGTIAVGRRADLTLLDTDRLDDLLAFARVRATIRAGRVLYRRA
ncbi:MAG: amidohydrolase family protein [Thermoplasmata archaeon]